MGLGGTSFSQWRGTGARAGGRYLTYLQAGGDRSKAVPPEEGARSNSLAGAGMERAGARDVLCGLVKVWTLGKSSWEASHSPVFPTGVVCAWTYAVCCVCRGGLATPGARYLACSEAGP